MARELIARATDAGLPCAWVVADSVYGGDGSLRLWLEERHQPYVLAITGQYRIFDGEKREWAVTIAKRRANSLWKRLSCGAGSKGERLYEWTCWQIRTIDEERRRWLLARRSLEDRGEVSCFVVSGPRTTTLEEMVRVVGARWAIEECFEVAIVNSSAACHPVAPLRTFESLAGWSARWWHVCPPGTARCIAVNGKLLRLGDPGRVRGKWA